MTPLLEAAFIVAFFGAAGVLVALTLELLLDASRPGEWLDDDPAPPTDPALDTDRQPTRHPEDHP